MPPGLFEFDEVPIAVKVSLLDLEVPPPPPPLPLLVALQAARTFANASVLSAALHPCSIHAVTFWKMLPAPQ
jgi:hypothetical protein